MNQEQTKQKESATSVKKQNAVYITAHGRRKEATAKVRLFKGKGDFLVNNKAIDQYFPGPVAKVKWQKPFTLTKSLGDYYAIVKVEGSGKSGQLGAVVHGLARALVVANPANRPILKKAGLLTRDPRVKERRKYGRAQKARKGKQSPKR